MAKLAQLAVSTDSGKTKVLLNGVDISYLCTSITISYAVGSQPTAVITMTTVDVSSNGWVKAIVATTPGPDTIEGFPWFEADPAEWAETSGPPDHATLGPSDQATTGP